MAKFICSKLASDNAYTTWHPTKKGANDLPRKDSQVLIKGGAGVANDRIMTPHGVVTEITDEQHKLLVDNCPSFNRHLKNGYLKVLEKNPSAADTKKVAADLESDKSAPLTPEQLAKEGKKAGKTSQAK